MSSEPPTTADDHLALFALLARPRVTVALLVLFTFLLGLVCQDFHHSLDEGSQWGAAQHPVTYIITHDPQNHPFYGVLVHLAMGCLPGVPLVALRLPAFIAGMLVPLVFYLTNRRYAGHEAALLVALFLTMTDPVRYYLSVGRGYSLMLLGVLVLNHQVVLSLRRGGLAPGLIYVPVGVATGMTHLWAFPVIGAHGLFLAQEVLRRRGKGAVARRALAMLAAVTATVLIGIAAVSPMLGEIRTVASRRGTTLMLGPLLDAVLQLPRFASWTVAVHLLLVPIILEGFARRPLRIRRDRVARLYLTTIVVLLAWSSLIHTAYFGSRYLLGLVPGAAGLVARGLSGYWRGRTSGRRLPVIPRPATWAIGLAMGVIAANAPIAHEIPPGATTSSTGKDSGYYYRDLAKSIGDPLACGLLAVGVAGLVVGRAFGRPRGAQVPRPEIATAWLLTLALLVSTVPLVLGPAASKHLFEVHMIAVAAVLLDAWQNRFNARHLHALRFAFLTIALIAMAWQANVATPEVTPRTFIGLAMYVPLVLLVLSLVRTAGPAVSDAQHS